MTFRSGLEGTALGEWARTRTVTLKPLEWRSFIVHADSDGLNRRELEIRCAWEPGLLSRVFSRDIIVGAAQEDLVGLPISVTPIPVTEAHFARSHETEANNPKSKDEEPIVGQLRYWPPVRTDDGVVNDKTGGITGWLVVGEDNFRDIWRRLSANPSPDFVIGLSILFEDGGDLHGRSTWDGEKPLRITEGKFVFRNMPSGKEGVKVQEESERDTSDEVGHHSTADKIDKILDSIQGTTKKMDMALIFSFIVVVILLLLRH